MQRILGLLASRLNAKVVSAAVLAAAAVIVFVSASSSGGDAFTPSVTVNFGVGSITVSVKLPGPGYYSYVGDYYSGYSYTSGYGSYYGSPIPVKVIVAVETAESSPSLVAYRTLDLEAYGTNNTATVAFTGLSPGSYRVKVLFWNGLLSTLSEEGGLWKSLAQPYKVEGVVS